MQSKIKLFQRSQLISLEWLYDRADTLTVTKARIATIIWHEKWKDMQNN